MMSFDQLIHFATHLEFLWPWAALCIVAPVLLHLLKKQTQGKTKVLAPTIPVYQQLRRAYGLRVQADDSKHYGSYIILALLWTLLTLALMRPQYTGPAIELPLEGRDLMLAIDISPSMQELDMPLNGERAMRIDVVKHVVGEFSQRRQGDRLGLILFGSQPYVQSPLSYDTQTLNTLLQEAFLGMAGQATAIGDAIALAVKRLKERPEQSRVIILLTDGANTAGEIPPEKAAQLAQAEGIKVYTVGIGADEMLQRSFFGSCTINPSSELDEAMLRTIADTTTGMYFRARNTEELEEIYSEINQLEPVETEKRVYRPKKALAYYLVLSALAGLLVLKLLESLGKAIQNLRANKEQGDGFQ